ncbi:MAG: hypothetical protein V3S99_12955 [Sphingomonas aquatilis]|jgi:hypothetical protein|uniref:hypothetical protein n=1 Tax=Sphingomonas aquatilis TaxID=93063 RepID=UPI002F2E8E44
MTAVVAVEAAPWDAATGAAVPVRLAGGGQRHHTWKGGTNWRGGIVSVPLAQAALGFDRDGFTGGAIATTAALGFMPSMASTAAFLAALMWEDAPITVSVGDDAAGEPVLTPLIAGTVAGYRIGGGRFEFTLSDMAAGLAKPLVTATFAGTGGIEGDVAATGRLKRRSWGVCANVEGRILLAAHNIWEFGDPSRPLAGFGAVRDRGRAGPLVVVGWAGSIADTLAALKAAAPPAGGAAVAPAIACVKWWTQPSGPLTADLLGETGDGYVETVAAIAARIAAAAGVTRVADLAAFVAARPHPAGLHAGEASESAAAMLDRLLLRTSLAWGVSPAGVLELRSIAFADPVETIRFTSVERVGGFAPVTALSIGYAHNHRPHTDAEISAAVLAGDVTYADGTPVEALKPAEAGATNSADPQSAFGGKKVIDALQVMERVPAIAADVSNLRDARTRLDTAVAGLRSDTDAAGVAIGALDDAVANGAAARRQMEQDAGRLSATSLQLLLIADGLTQRLRDAGIAIDPNTGVVRIYAVDALAERQRSAEITLDAQAALIRSKASSSEVDEKILKAVLDPAQVAQLEPIIARLAAIEVAQDGIRAELRTKAELVELSRAVARLTTAEQAISATDALVQTKVAQTAFDQALFRIASAEQTLQAYGDVSRLSLELRQARADNRESGAGLLAAVLAGNDAAVRQISAQADLRQELYTSITGVGDALTLEARARTLLAATVGDLNARSVQDRQLLIRADAVLAQDIDGLRAASDSQAGEIATLRKTSVDAAGGITLLGTTLRQQVRRASEADGATLAGVLAGDEAARRITTGLAEVQTQLTATLVAGFSAAAAERLALRAQIDAADARYTREVQATADRFKSVTQAITVLETEYGRQSADLVATRAEIADLARTTSAADKATAELIAGLRAIVIDPATGLGKTRAELTALTDAVATQNTAAVRRLETLEASVNDPTTGLAKTRAALADLAKAFSNELSANAESLREVRASIGTATREVAAQAEQARSAGENRLRTDIADKYEHTMDAIDSANALRDAGDAANRSAIGQVDSRVTDVARAQASDKAALAESIKQVSTTVGGHTTTIDFLLRSLDGKEAVAQLTINANGKITGFVINGQQSVFAVAADKFIVGNSQIFEIDTATGQTVVNAIKAGIITAREIAAGAVQQTVFAVTDADIVIQYG